MLTENSDGVLLLGFVVCFSSQGFCVSQTVLELSYPPAFATQVLGLKGVHIQLLEVLPSAE